MLTKLDINQIKYIYNTYMVKDFPPDELKPLSHIERMVREGLCTCYALFEGEQVVSYANICEYMGYALIDYFAVNPRLRGKGIGSYTLELLKETLEGSYILVECEDPAAALNEEEKKTRCRRIAFYERAGFRLTDVKARLFGVDYLISTFPQGLPDTAFAYEQVYYQMLKKDMFDQNLEVFKI